MHDLDQVSLEMDDYETEYLEDDAENFADEYGFDDESPFDDAEEMELASELLSVSNDEELEYFLGSLIKRVYRGVKKVARSPIVRAIAKVARPLVKKALPWAGRAVGTYFGGPAGGALGGRLASFAASKLEIDLTGLTQEEAEFEVARKMVKLIGAAAKKAATMPQTGSPAAVASTAIKSAAKKIAPGLVQSAHKAFGSRSGRWVRHGRKIIIHGA